MIEFRNVEKSLGGRKVLDHLSFHVKEGETFILVGPSGTGKSVTLSHIIGLMRPDAGSVTVDGLHVETMRRKELESLRRRTGMLFQGAMTTSRCRCGNAAASQRRKSAERFWKSSSFWSWRSPCIKCPERYRAAW